MILIKESKKANLSKVKEIHFNHENGALLPIFTLEDNTVLYPVITYSAGLSIACWYKEDEFKKDKEKQELEIAKRKWWQF